MAAGIFYFSTLNATIAFNIYIADQLGNNTIFDFPSPH